MKVILLVAISAAFVIGNAAIAQDCGDGVTPRTRVALLQSAEALTKCSAFFHLLSMGSIANKDPDAFRITSTQAREAIIISAMMVTMARVPDSDPTTKFNEYLQGFDAPLTAGGADWARGFSAQCRTENTRARKVMLDYRDGR
jgi:hypothetical protein